jgi:ankyrin repeat protein
MFNSRVSTIFQRNDNDNDSIICAIVTGNLIQVKKLVNRSNVNRIIDLKNKYLPIHYALSDNEILKYLLDIGADPTLKQGEGYDAYELSVRLGKTYIFDYYKENQEIKITSLENENKELVKKNNKLVEENAYLSRSIDNYNNRILSYDNTMKRKIEECDKLKKDLNESEKAFTNLLKKQKK